MALNRLFHEYHIEQGHYAGTRTTTISPFVNIRRRMHDVNEKSLRT